MKALFINGSPRKNGNTAQLLKRAMDGAREAGGVAQEIKQAAMPLQRPRQGSR